MFFNDSDAYCCKVLKARIGEGRPAVIFGEQVASADGRVWLAGVRYSLEVLGYAFGAADLCSAGVGAPHIRQRLWWVAYAQGTATRAGDVLRTRQSDAWYGGSNGGMDDAAKSRRARQAESREATAPRNEARLPQSERRSGISGVGVTNSVRPQSGQQASEALGYGGSSITNGGFWSDYDLIPCADGKARRVEPGTFPLAHGVPNRVGQLRAYGNAINPWLAAEFILAAEEATS